jgi:hypothetical protein
MPRAKRGIFSSRGPPGRLSGPGSDNTRSRRRDCAGSSPSRNSGPSSAAAWWWRGASFRPTPPAPPRPGCSYRRRSTTPDCAASSPFCSTRSLPAQQCSGRRSQRGCRGRDQQFFHFNPPVRFHSWPSSFQGTVAQMVAAFFGSAHETFARIPAKATASSGGACGLAGLDGRGLKFEIRANRAEHSPTTKAGHRTRG